MRGRFITLEGLDGAGKTVAIDAVVSTIKAAGIEVITTREVGGTEMGEAIRELVLSKDSEIYPNAEVLLMFAARSQHLEEVILPKLEAKCWVVCDRFTDSTYAYQGGGRQIGFARIAEVEAWTQGEFRPDLTLLYDADVDTVRNRVEWQSGAPDRFESESLEFHARVRSAFSRLLHAYPERIKLIDASKPVAEVRAASCQLIERFIEQVHGVST